MAIGKIRPSWDSLTFITRILILVRRHLCIDLAPRTFSLSYPKTSNKNDVLTFFLGYRYGEISNIGMLFVRCVNCIAWKLHIFVETFDFPSTNLLQMAYIKLHSDLCSYTQARGHQSRFSPCLMIYYFNDYASCCRDNLISFRGCLIRQYTGNIWRVQRVLVRRQFDLNYHSPNYYSPDVCNS